MKLKNKKKIEILRKNKKGKRNLEELKKGAGKIRKEGFSKVENC